MSYPSFNITHFLPQFNYIFFHCNASLLEYHVSFAISKTILYIQKKKIIFFNGAKILNNSFFLYYIKKKYIFFNDTKYLIILSFYIIPKRFYLFNVAKYLIIFSFDIIPKKRNYFFIGIKYSIIF